MTSVGPTNYTIRAEGDNSAATKADEVAGLWVELDENGTFRRGEL